jgi:hypothetical protein
MTDEPIIQEIREAREALLSRFGNDLNTLVKHLQDRTDDASRTGAKVVTRRPRPGISRPVPTKKVG